MDRSQKEIAVKELEEIFDGAGSVVMTAYSGMTEAASEKFTGPVAIAWAEDMISAPKVVVEYAKDSDNFDVIGGFMGDEVLDINGVVTLSKLPSREELISMAAQLLLAPATSISSALMSPARNLSGAIATIEEKATA